MDPKAECILLPVYGMLVPFHITTVKNVTHNQVRGVTETLGACDVVVWVLDQVPCHGVWGTRQC